MPIKLLFFPSLFPSYCHSIVHRVVSIVSVGCKQSSFVFSYVVFESLYRGVNAVSDAGNSLPHSFLDTYSLSTSSLGCNTLCMVISFLLLWSICLSSSLVHCRKGTEYLRYFFSSLTIFLLNFVFHFHLFGGVSLQ